MGFYKREAAVTQALYRSLGNHIIKGQAKLSNRRSHRSHCSRRNRAGEVITGYVKFWRKSARTNQRALGGSSLDITQCPHWPLGGLSTAIADESESATTFSMNGRMMLQ